MSAPPRIPGPGPAPLEALRMRGVDGTGYPARARGVAMYVGERPVNRAQRRFLSRLRRRGQV
jgi:hypothetical protein